MVLEETVKDPVGPLMVCTTGVPFFTVPILTCTVLLSESAFVALPEFKVRTALGFVVTTWNDFTGAELGTGVGVAVFEAVGVFDGVGVTFTVGLGVGTVETVGEGEGVGVTEGEGVGVGGTGAPPPPPPPL